MGLSPEEQFAAFQRNHEAHARGDAKMSAIRLAEMLNDLGDPHDSKRWRIVWEEMPRDISFESLHAMRADGEGVWPFLFRQVAKKASTHAVMTYEEIEGRKGWFAFIGPDAIIDWLISHEPLGMAAIARLYAYSRTMYQVPKAYPPFAPAGTPWITFCALVGQRKAGTNGIVPDKHIKGGVSLHKVVPLANLQDAELVGEALIAFYNHVDVALAYIHLLDAYDSHRESGKVQ